MERKIGAFDARRQFGKILNEVVVHRDRYVIERHGEAIAAVVPIQLYEQWKRSRDAFFEGLEQTARRSNVSEAEGMDLALEAVQAVRRERRARPAPSGA